MKPLNLIVLASIIAVAGRWSKSGTIDTKMVVGGAVLSIGFAVLGEAQPKLAEPFAYLILVSILSSYGEDLFTTVGKITTGSKGGDTTKTNGVVSAGRAVA